MARYDDSSIRQMTAMEHIRNKSSMYVGAADLDADVQLFKEIFDNSADESIDPNKIYKIKVVFLTKGNRYQVVIQDEGRGIPCGKMVELYTEPYTSGKYSEAAYNGISTGTFGIGSKATVALSKRFLSISKRSEGLGKIVTSKGKVVSYTVDRALPGKNTGTIVVYETDRDILTRSGRFMTDPDGLTRVIELIEYIAAFKKNTRIEVYSKNDLFPDKWYDTQSAEDQWNYISDLAGDLVYASPEDINPMDYVRSKYDITDKMVWDIKLDKTIDLENEMDVHGFDIWVGISAGAKTGIIASVNSNMMNDWQSSHVLCLINVLKSKIADYLDTDNGELCSYFKTKYNLPVFGYIRTFFKNASFEGQTKKSFKDVAFAAVYTERLTKMVDMLPAPKWESLFNIIAPDLEEKFLASSNRALRVGRSLKNVAADMINIGSYIPCDIKNNEITELLITEGDNAGGYVKAVRDPAYQAVFKLTGKPINALSADDAALRANAVYQDMLRLFGVGPNDTNLDNFNYNKIGLLADADPDGYHIQALLVGNIYKINPLILETGRVFIATPPLYVLETKTSNIFLRDQHALNDLKVESYQSYFDIELAVHDTGKIYKLNYNTFRDFVYMVKRIGIVMTDVANNLVIEPMILEQLVHCVSYLSVTNIDCNKIKEMLGLDNCIYQKIANTILLVYSGIEVSIPLDRLVPEIYAYLIPELEDAHWDKYSILLSSKVVDKYKRLPVSFMQLYSYFEEMDAKFPIRRLKGLGECTAEQLKHTCVDPLTRTYATIRSVGDVARLYDMLGVDAASRKKMLQADIGIGF